MAAPAELLMFSEDEWADSDDGSESWRAFERWKEARRVYGKTHPDSELGTVLEQMRFERRVQGLRSVQDLEVSS